MRPVICATGFLLVLSAVAHAAGNLTVVLQFESSPSQPSLSEMKREAQNLIGVDLDWRLLKQLSSSESFPDVVVVKFNGTCEMKPALTSGLMEATPLGYTHTSNGQILPYTEMECDRIRRSIAPAARGFDAPERDLMFGRALGRVLAHELHHVIKRTRAHSKGGFTRESLSVAQLVGNSVKN